MNICHALILGECLNTMTLVPGSQFKRYPGMFRFYLADTERPGRFRLAKAGSGIYCSPRHMMTCMSRNESLKHAHHVIGCHGKLKRRASGMRLTTW